MRLGLLAGRWRYTDRGILDSTHLRFFTRRTLGETLERAGYRILELDFTVPVPGHRSTEPWNGPPMPSDACVPRSSRYQFVVAATPVAR